MYMLLYTCLRLHHFGGARCYWPLQRSRTLLLLPPGPRNAAATPRHCNCCFQGHATLLQHSQTLELLLPGPRNAPGHHVTNDAQSCY